jgi:hypothetical protein
MKRASLLALLGLFAAACKAPLPRIPFQSGASGFHVSAVSSARESDDRYLDSYPVFGLELTTLAPGAEGWGWDVGFRYASDEGDDKEHIRTIQGPTGNTMRVDVDVPTHRESDVYELSVGTRQVYFPDARLQPYFGVGGTFIKAKNVDTFDLSGVPPHNNKLLEEEHHHDNSLGLYLRTGLQWSVLRDQLGKDTEVVVSLDLRGLLGTEFSFLELGLGVGFGK